MAHQDPHIFPSIYLAGYLDDFRELVRSYPVHHRVYQAGDYLTQRGTINNTAFFICSGIIQLSLGHNKGAKALNLFGPGTVFPLGVEVHEYFMEYEMIIRALTDVEAYSMSYPTLKRIVVEHGAFAGELLRENCDFVGYLFFDAINRTFEPCLARICDILYLCLTKIHPGTPRVPLSQVELARIAGASHAQLERSLKLLRDEGVISTSRGAIKILDTEALHAHCTLGLRSEG